jgi:glycosyltransferase involved in cell wall biosynthesis
MKPKLIRITTVPLSLDKLLEHQLRFMSSHYDITAISSGGPELEKIAIKEGVKVYPVLLTRKITPLADIKAVYRLYWFLKRKTPHIVHTHTPKAGIIGMLAARLAGVPVRLHTIAGLPLLEAGGMKRKLLNVIERVTYACATYIYPNSYGLRDIILDTGFCKEHKVKVIANGSSNGINATYFDPELFNKKQVYQLRSQWNIRPENFVFVFVGRLVGDKGINELVRAFDYISATRTGVKLLLVGPPEPDLDALLPETEWLIKANKNIICTGYQSDVRPFYAISDVLTFPSYREGFPNVVMQAGAMGLPAIVSNINGCNEIIKDGRNGLIIPVKNTEALQRAMLKVLDDPDLYRELQVNARPMITTRYQREAVWDALLDEYRRLMHNL